MNTRSIRAEKEQLRRLITGFQLEIATLSKALAEQKDTSAQRELELLTDFFEIVDAFDKLEASYGAKEDALDKTAKKLLKSLRSISKKVQRSLKNHDIEAILFPEGKARMALCRIVETTPSPDRENEEILSVVKKGYQNKKTMQVLRKAEVRTVLNEDS